MRPTRHRSRSTAIFALVAVLGMTSAVAVIRPVAADASALDFLVVDLDGSTRQLSSMRGRITIVAFWATWCFPCRYELPLLQRLYRRSHGDGLQVVAVASDDELDAVRSYVQERAFTFPVLFDPTGDALRHFGATSVPATFLLDADGQTVALRDPASGRETMLMDNPLIWSHSDTLMRIDELLQAAEVAN